MAVYALYDTSSEDLYALAKACGRERMFDGEDEESEDDEEDEEDESMMHTAPHACLLNSTVEDVAAHHRNMVSDPAHEFDDYIAIAESKEWCTEGVLVVTLDETDWEGLGGENGARKRKRGYDTCLFEAGVVWLAVLSLQNRDIGWVELEEHEETLVDGNEGGGSEDEVDDEVDNEA